MIGWGKKQEVVHRKISALELDGIIAGFATNFMASHKELYQRNPIEYHRQLFTEERKMKTNLLYSPPNGKK